YFLSLPEPRHGGQVDIQSSGSMYTPSQEKKPRIVPMLESKKERLIQLIIDNPKQTYASFKHHNISKTTFKKLRKIAQNGPGFMAKLKQLDQLLFDEFMFNLSNGAIIRDLDLRRWSIK